MCARQKSRFGDAERPVCVPMQERGNEMKDRQAERPIGSIATTVRYALLAANL
jgi:hypothetical protein